MNTGEPAAEQTADKNHPKIDSKPDLNTQQLQNKNDTNVITDKKSDEILDAAETDRQTAMPDIVTNNTPVEFKGGFMHHVKLMWNNHLNVFYEYPEFDDKVPAHQRINRFFEDNNKAFFSKENLEKVWEYHIDMIERDEVFDDAVKAEITTLDDKIVSVQNCLQWFMGGVQDYGCSGFVFDVNTGEQISLEKYTGLSHDKLANLIIKTLKTDESERSNDINWDSIEKIENYNFYIKDNKIHVVFKKYEIAIGASGAFDIVLKIQTFN